MQWSTSLPETSTGTTKYRTCLNVCTSISKDPNALMWRLLHRCVAMAASSKVRGETRSNKMVHPVPRLVFIVIVWLWLLVSLIDWYASSASRSLGEAGSTKVMVLETINNRGVCCGTYGLEGSRQWK